MAAADIGILAVIGLYSFFGLFHGFVVSMLRLISLVAMFMVLTVFAEPLAQSLPFVQAFSFSDQMAFLMVVGPSFGAIIAATWLITFFFKGVPANPASRLLGGVIGVLRASVFLVLAIIISSLLPRDWMADHWRQSALLRMYGVAAEVALTLAPPTGPGGEPTQLSRIEFDPDTRQPSLPMVMPAVPILEAPEEAAVGGRVLDLENEFIPPADEDPLEVLAPVLDLLQKRNGDETAGNEITGDDGLRRLRNLTGGQRGDSAATRRQLEELLGQVPLEKLGTEARETLEKLLEAQSRQP